MQSQKLEYRTAHNRVLKKRTMIHPNYGFQRQLAKFAELEYKPVETLAPLALADVVKYYRMFDAKNPRQAFEKLSFFCIRCDEPLFKGTDVCHSDHMVPTGSAKKKYCAYYFLQQVSWMEEEPEYSLHKNEGQLFCKKCDWPIGKFSWSGSLCTCSARMTPAFYVSKSDVKFV